MLRHLGPAGSIEVGLQGIVCKHFKTKRSGWELALICAL